MRDLGLRPQVPAALPEDLRPLMERCWAEAPDDRPNFREISAHLKGICNRFGTVVQAPSTKLPLGPEARHGSESSQNSFSGSLSPRLS